MNKEIRFPGSVVPESMAEGIIEDLVSAFAGTPPPDRITSAENRLALHEADLENLAEGLEAARRRIDTLLVGFVLDELHEARERLAALEARVAGLEEHRQGAFVQSVTDTEKGAKARGKAH
jgi:hypothetical protein